MPLAMDFLIKMGMEVGTPIITVADYVSVLMLLVFGFGLVFETPVILVLLALLDIVDAKMLSDNRKFVVVAVMILGALLTLQIQFRKLPWACPHTSCMKCLF